MDKRYSIFICIAIFVLFSFLVQLSASDDKLSVKSHPEFCSPRFHIQPSGPFAVITFCEDALGSHIGIIYYDSMTIPIDGDWKLSDRFWQEEDWANDVTTFVWGPNGKYLFVSTAAVYGSGSVFQLDLRSRRSRRLSFGGKLTIDHVLITKIISIDSKKNEILILLTSSDLKREEKLRIHY